MNSNKNLHFEPDPPTKNIPHLFFFRGKKKHPSVYIQGVSERRYHFYRSICKKYINASKGPLPAKYWY